ncbi:MAG: hypothetical protein J6A75_13445 [Lachnospiraceae bacterium]|nr:hypothetical protein [Lachnospiraceae bacterium]
MEDFLTKTHCDRCGGKLIARVTSMINEDTICLSCKKVEQQLPIYEQARAVEFGEVKAGNYNYEGVGFEKPDTSKRCDVKIIITEGKLHIAYDYGEPKVIELSPEWLMVIRNLRHNGSIEVKDLRGSAEDLSLNIKPTAEADTVDALISVLEAHRGKKLSCCGSSCIVNVLGDTVVLDTEVVE